MITRRISPNPEDSFGMLSRIHWLFNAVPLILCLSGCGSEQSAEVTVPIEESSDVVPAPTTVSSMQVRVEFLAESNPIASTVETGASNSAPSDVNQAIAAIDPQAGDLLGRPPKLATGLTLVGESGREFRLADAASAPAKFELDQATGEYRVTITYTPLPAGGILGAPASQLGDLKIVRLRLGPVLGRLGLHLSRVTAIKATVNGTEYTLVDRPTDQVEGSEQFSIQSSTRAALQNIS